MGNNRLLHFRTSWPRLLPVFAALLLAASARGVEVPWLYDVAVPVADQSSSARLDAAGRALAVVLTRLTGLASVPRNDEVTGALAAPDLYYNQFRFEQAPAGEEGLALRLQFVPQAVLDLIRDAGLPVWSANRPTTMVWIAVDDGRERRLLGADSDHPVVEAVVERTQDRGVPIRLPLLDLTDQLAVEPAAVWGRLSQILEPASERYGAETILIGRLVQQGEQAWSASWELWVDGEVRTLEQQARDPAPLGRAAADLVADELAARYAVLDRGVRRLAMAVSAVTTPADYADMLRYLGGLEFIQEVAVQGVSGDRLELSLITAAGEDQLLELFRLDRRLLLDPAGTPPGSPIELVWQRR